MIAATAGERFAVRDRALLEVLYGSGIRVREAMGLRVENVLLEKGIAGVRGKGRLWRRIFLGSRAVASLGAYLEEEGRAEGWVFRNARGGRLTNRGMRRVVEKYAAKAGVPHSSPHTLRHSCASHLLVRGAYLFGVKEVLGHRSAATTARYLHWIDPGESAEAIYRRTHPHA